MSSTTTITSRSGGLVCERCEKADRPLRRMRGLLGRDVLEPGDGLLLTPAGSIHTWFMRFPIDAVFLDGSGRVLHVAGELAPWRTARRRGARAVLELAGGEASRRELRPGQVLLTSSPRSDPPGFRPRQGARRAALVALLALLGVAHVGVTPRGALVAFAAGVLGLLAAIDAERRVLPNRIVLPAFAAVLAAQVAIDPVHAPEPAAAALGAALLLALPRLVRADAIGMGDVKLGLLMGAAVGWRAFEAIAIGSVGLVVFAALRREPLRGTTLPFGPFLAAGTLLELIAR